MTIISGLGSVSFAFHSRKGSRSAKGAARHKAHCLLTFFARVGLIFENLYKVEGTTVDGSLSCPFSDSINYFASDKSCNFCFDYQSLYFEFIQATETFFQNSLSLISFKFCLGFKSRQKSFKL